jgi:hypothetical protein
MEVTVGCWLLAVGYSLFAVRYSLFAHACWERVLPIRLRAVSRQISSVNLERWNSAPER